MINITLTHKIVSQHEKIFCNVKLKHQGFATEYHRIYMQPVKEQWLHFAGAAMKRFPTFKARESQVKQQVLREGIRRQTH